jgi:hypothetical protein
MKSLALLVCATMLLVSDGAGARCVLSTERPMVEAQLFFGRDVEGRSAVTDAEWNDFAASELAADFPDGFTVSDGSGNWRDPVSGETVREGTKIVLIVARDSRALPLKLKRVMEAYRKRFHQQSVGIVTRDVCAAF